MKKLLSFVFQRRFTEGAALLSGLTFLSYVTGLLRDRIFAHTFGAGRELDLFNASFLIPDLLLNIFVMSALSAAFIPIFTGLFAEGKREEANRLAGTMLVSAVLVIFLLGGIAAIFMPYLADFIAPGFSPEEKEKLTSLTRLMMISPLIMAVSNTFGGMLVSFKRFIAYGISPIIYNLGIIAGALAAPSYGVYSLVLGTIFGALLHLIPRAVALRKSPVQIRPQLHFRDPHFLKVIILMLPKIFGHPVEQMTFFAFTRAATLLAAGSVTAMNFARNFQSVPVSLFGIAFSVAIFPTLCEEAARGNRKQFLSYFWKACGEIIVLTVLSAIGLYLLADLPIRIFLGGGRFSNEDILLTASVLAVFSFSIPTESLVHLLARSFYALKNTITPVLLSLLGFAISVSFATYQTPRMGILAIPWAFFLGSGIEVILLAILLAIKIRTFPPQSSPSLHRSSPSDSSH